MMVIKFDVLKILCTWKQFKANSMHQQNSGDVLEAFLFCKQHSWNMQ